MDADHYVLQDMTFAEGLNEKMGHINDDGWIGDDDSHIEGLVHFTMLDYGVTEVIARQYVASQVKVAEIKEKVNTRIRDEVALSGQVPPDIDDLVYPSSRQISNLCENARCEFNRWLDLDSMTAAVDEPVFRRPVPLILESYVPRPDDFVDGWHTVKFDYAGFCFEYFKGLPHFEYQDARFCFEHFYGILHSESQDRKIAVFRDLVHEVREKDIRLFSFPDTGRMNYQDLLRNLPQGEITGTRLGLDDMILMVQHKERFKGELALAEKLYNQAWMQTKHGCAFRPLDGPTQEETDYLFR